MERHPSKGGNANGSSWLSKTERNFLFSKGYCIWCLDSFEIKQKHADHARPRNKAGEDTLTNCLPSCARCNTRRKNLTMKAWSYQLARELGGGDREGDRIYRRVLRFRKSLRDAMQASRELQRLHNLRRTLKEKKPCA